jgi:hypothetical protein
MTLRIGSFAMALSILLLGGCAGLRGPAEVSDREMGVRLVWEMWQDIEDGNVEALADLMAPGFQSLHQFGGGGREATLEVVRNLEAGSYTLDNFRVTRTGPVLVVTYEVAVEETIRGTRLPKAPSPRMTVFIRTERGRWRWLAHANPRTVGASEEGGP